MAVPCGKCAVCLSKKRGEWSFRLQQEAKVSEQVLFVTLTYDDVHEPYNDAGYPTVRKEDCQNFLKRLRERLPRRSLRYYLTSEYGPNTFRPHYHAIFFLKGVYYELSSWVDILNDVWKLGFVSVAKSTDATIHYVTKYCLKDSPDCGGDKVFNLMSRMPGLGANYLETHSQYHKEDRKRQYVIYPGGIKGSLPKYYKDKIYNSDSELFKHLLRKTKERAAAHRQELEQLSYVARAKYTGAKSYWQAKSEYERYILDKPLRDARKKNKF